MKILRQFLVGGTRCVACISSVVLFTGLAVQSEAQVYTLNDANSSLTVNVGPSGITGATNWTVNGVNQLNRQWFFYRGGSAGPENPIENISSALVSMPAADRLDLTYTNSGYSVQVRYDLTGSATLGNSGLSQTLTVWNSSSTNVTFHFYEYEDYDLNGVTGGQGGNAISLINSVQFNQTNSTWPTSGFRVTSQNTTAGIAPFVEAATYASTLSKLTDGVPDNLNNSVSAGIGNVTFARQWDINLDPGLSKSWSLITTIVPEPSSIALISLGAICLGLCRRRSR